MFTFVVVLVIEFLTILLVRELFCGFNANHWFLGTKDRKRFILLILFCCVFVGVFKFFGF